MRIDPINHPLLTEKNICMDMLRLDLLHPAISGNKWFKLKYNIKQAEKEDKKTLLSFGGAYSNHLHALAFAGKKFLFKTIGIIRGEEVTNDTLSDCKKWGMELHFISRTDYRNKYETDFLYSIQEKYPEAYIIPEGANNQAGINGCKEILSGINTDNYDIITCAVGSGTTFTGLIESAIAKNQLLGFAAIKNGAYLAEEIRKNTLKQNWELLTDYHFGGFAKKNNELTDFMEDFKRMNSIELDFIYNAKMMYGLYDLARQDRLSNRGRILAIHTGGLQGNRSLF